MPLEDVLSRSACTYAALRRATRRLGQIYDDAVAASGLKSTQVTLLYQVRRLQQPTVRQLANELVMDLSALGHTLKPLERDGLVDLHTDSRDRRAKRVHLTEAGNAKLDLALSLWQSVHRRSEEVLGAEKAAELREMLDWMASQPFAQRFSECDRSAPEAAYPKK